MEKEFIPYQESLELKELGFAIIKIITNKYSGI
jgi:hypothetical protein